jgi:(E)-4-hydroxy-3-methylbut-2-enyl-diphosphate synthase
MKVMNRMCTKNTISRKIQVGNVYVGGNAPITVQSMTKTKTENINATVTQIKELEVAGCEIIRCAVPNEKAAYALKDIVKQVRIPVVADIHFNYKLALIALESGAHKIRINPGNIGSRKRIENVLRGCQERLVPIRIGVNSGSIEPDILKKYGKPTAEALVDSALKHVRICEEFKFYDIIISIKSSNVKIMIDAYRLLYKQVKYPLHLGVTEAGPIWSGTIKSSIGIGTLLSEGIGDTIRVSLTGEPHEEVQVGKEILKTLGLRESGITIISCPTCGRLDTPDLAYIAQQIEEQTKSINKDLTVAIMGCAVNGPGEAREADLGIACGKNEALLFKRGKIEGKIIPQNIVKVLIAEIKNF